MTTAYRLQLITTTTLTTSTITTTTTWMLSLYQRPGLNIGPGFY